jgi:hypothetical protein
LIERKNLRGLEDLGGLVCSLDGGEICKGDESCGREERRKEKRGETRQEGFKAEGKGETCNIAPEGEEEKEIGLMNIQVVLKTWMFSLLRLYLD